MNAVSIGPLVFAGDGLAATVGIGIFMLVSSFVSSRLDHRIGRWSSWALGAGLVAARLGHVIGHAASFAAEPWRIFAVWQGGFSWPWGAAAIAVVSAVLVRSRRAALAATGSLVVALIAWNLVWHLTGHASATPMPDANLQTLEGGSVSLRSFGGKSIVVNLWASWCPPCRREMPMLADVAADRKDVTFVFVNQGEGRSAVEAFLRNPNHRLSTVLLDPHMAVARHYGTPGLPVTLFVGKDGRLRSVHFGEISRESVTDAVDRLLVEQISP